MRAGTILVALLLLLAPAGAAYAEYRAYKLEIVDIFDCRLNERKKCKIFRVSTAMSPDLYARTHGGADRIGVILLATWFCRGDTSNFKPVCPWPAPKKPRLAVGDEVMVMLEKHITEGWRGKVEVAYRQASLNSNVYGVRFSDRKQVYARYFEKDLKKIGSAKPKPEKKAPQ